MVVNSKVQRDKDGGLDVTVIANAVCGGRNFPVIEQSDMPENYSYPNMPAQTAMAKLIATACSVCPNRIPESYE